MDLPGDARTSASWNDIARPDWVIIGGPLPDGTGVALLASKTLTSARLHALATDKVYLGQMTAGWAKTGVFLGLDVTMDDFVVAAGADYFEALEALFEHFLLPDFKPKPVRPAIAAEQVPQLEAGPVEGEVLTPPEEFRRYVETGMVPSIYATRRALGDERQDVLDELGDP